MSQEPVSPAAQDSTAELLRFATDPAREPTVFDGANASLESLGQQVEGAAWWDGARSGLKLRGRVLEGASLRQVDLSRADLGGAKLSGVKGVGLHLRYACLEGTDLTDGDLIGANLRSVSAGEAVFAGALLEDADLEEAQLRFADFSDAIMDGAKFAKADLWGAKLHKTVAERAEFSGARLDESSLAGGDFSAADFAGATLRRADLSGARLRGAIFRGAVLDGAKLSGADLSGAVLPHVSLATCELQHASFAGAWLERTRMRANQLGGMVGEESKGELEAAVDSYIVLERNFLSLGSSEDASWAYRRRRRVGRALHRKQALAALRERRWGAAVVPVLGWVGDAISEWLCDYGESVGRVVRAFFTVMVVFALVYWLTGSLRPRDGFPVVHGAYEVMNYLLFSLDSMTTVGTSEVPLKAVGELATLLSSFETILGTILLGLFGFVLGARIRG